MKYTMYFAGLIACFFSIVAAQAQESKFLNSPARKLQLAEFAIANLYVDEVNEGKLVEEAIVKMLEQLDPHSTYSDPEEVKRMNEPLQGNFEGIGIQFNMAEDTLLVIQPVSGGPSEKVGILAGDRIVMGETQFKLDEAERLSTMLGLTMAERDACFFDAENRFSRSATLELPKRGKRQ